MLLPRKIRNVKIQTYLLVGPRGENLANTQNDHSICVKIGTLEFFDFLIQNLL